MALPLSAHGRLDKSDPQVASKIKELEPKARKQIQDVEDADYKAAAALYADCHFP